MNEGDDGWEFATLLERLLDRRSLTETEAAAIMDTILAGDLGPERIAAFVTAMRAKGVVVDELVGFARSMRRHARPLQHDLPLLVDTCGTGGARHKAFNVSTAAAFLVAAAGIPVAKHGNRSVTRPSGSADVLESAGARLDLAPDQVASILRKTGITFLFAPTFHPAMRHAGPVRKALGIRTVFNLLGPLTNPAHATHQVLGVHDPDLLRPMAEALARLGVRGGAVVYGEPGYDEAMPTGLVHVVDVRGDEAGGVRTFDPGSLGLASARPHDLLPVPKKDAGALLRSVLGGKPGPRADAVALNAGLALVAAGRSATLQEGLERARGILTSGAAAKTLDAFVAATQAVMAQPPTIETAPSAPGHA